MSFLVSDLAEVAIPNAIKGMIRKAIRRTMANSIDSGAIEG